MYPTISDFIQDVFGIYIPLPIQTFGFFVALAFLTGSWIISKELKRKEKEGILKVFVQDKIVGQKATPWQILSSTVIGFIIGFKLVEIIFNYSDFVDNPQQLILSSRGDLIGGILGAIVYSYTKYRDYAKKALSEPKTIKEKIHPYEIVGNITLIAALSGILGAKIAHNLENIEALLQDPIGQLLDFGGLSFWGGLIGAAPIVIWYCRKYNIHYTHISDSAAPALLLAYAVGRLGCHFAGDGCWGISNTCDIPEHINFLPDWIWHYDYKNGVSKPPDDLVYPTSIYESIMASVLFLFIWIIRKKISIPGMLFSIYLIVAGLERLLIEQIRRNPNWLGDFTQAEIISLCLIFSGCGIMFYLNHLRRNHLYQ